MKKPTAHTDGWAPRSVTDFIKLKTGASTIQIGFANQRVSVHAGVVALCVGETDQSFSQRQFSSVLVELNPDGTPKNAVR